MSSQAVSIDESKLRRAGVVVDMGHEELQREIRAFCLQELEDREE
jgi:hypothetical protein